MLGFLNRLMFLFVRIVVVGTLTIAFKVGLTMVIMLITAIKTGGKMSLGLIKLTIDSAAKKEVDNL